MMTPLHPVVSLLTLKVAIQISFATFSVVSLLATLIFLNYDPQSTTFDWVYVILFPLSFLTTMSVVIHPKVGTGAFMLLPFFFGAFIRVIDFWYTYLSDTSKHVYPFLLGSVGWVFAIGAIFYISVLEDRLYLALNGEVRFRGEVSP